MYLLLSISLIPIVSILCHKLKKKLQNHNDQKILIFFLNFLYFWKKNLNILWFFGFFFKLIFKYFKHKIWCGIFFTRGQLKKNEKKCQISATYANLLSWMGERGILEFFFVYKDANQTENFIGAKTENSIYYRGEKHY